MDARVGEALEAPAPTIVAPLKAAPPPVAESIRERAPSVRPIVPAGSEEEGAGSWPDEAAESSFLAEARNRGEMVMPAKTKEEMADDTDAGPLPPLNELVNRIPTEVREALDDLFRVRFTTVRRVPRQALKE